MDTSSETSSDEDIIIIAVAILCDQAIKQRKRKNKWVHDICKKRPIYGEHHTLFPDLIRDPARFFEYFRMSYEKFEELLGILYNDLSKKDTNFRRSIGPEERLAVCLRFLGTGDSFKTIAFSYRLGHTTVREIVHETCEIIWKRLSPQVLPVPNIEMWKGIEEMFSSRWNFPNCVGALDGKHIIIEAPGNTGSMYFNYKKTFSIVLMALVDANYKFIAVDVGAYGKSSDGGIFSNCEFGKAINEGRLNLPNDKPPPGSDVSLPHVIVGDEAFPLKKNIMRPYPGSQLRGDESKKVFNYRLSRARRISENAFGILTHKFRLYQRRIKMNPEHVDNVVLATCCLHNFLIGDNMALPAGNIHNNNAPIMRAIENMQHRNSTREALAIRDSFKNYFVSAAGSVGWQIDMIRRGLL